MAKKETNLTEIIKRKMYSLKYFCYNLFGYLDYLIKKQPSSEHFVKFNICG